MRILKLDSTLTASAQVEREDLQTLKAQGVSLLVCNRPDGEADDQTAFTELAAQAKELGIDTLSIPFKPGQQTPEQVTEFTKLLAKAELHDQKVHAFCRTGNRSTCLWSAAKVSQGADAESILATAKEAGFDVSEAIKPYLGEKMKSAETTEASAQSYDVVIIGAGSGGIAAASSLLKRKGGLRIALVDPAEEHYYQPGWTMVGGGIFSNTQTKRAMSELIPNKVSWIKQAAVGFSPEQNTVQLDNQQSLHYTHLIVAPGLVLNWDGIKGLKESLGKNGVTSNYSYEHSAYTWQLVQNLKKGRAIFTQPPMPIKCAGAPQKALYLSGDHWFRSGVLKDINIDFFNAGGVLFGVAAYVPALQKYIEKYRAKTHFNHTLVEVDGENKRAYFKSSEADKDGELRCEEFDMIHVCPPQKAPDFVAQSALADAGGWLDVDQFSLQHKKFANIWGLGDVMNTPNAKTMAAVRKQVPVVAANIVASMNSQELSAGYDGYGSCPLTVQRGKIVLAEFGYGGKLLPSFPKFLLNGTSPTWGAWILKKDMLPAIYWHAMLKGREWLAAPKKLKALRDA